jgi:hypothetical protein
MKYFQSIVFALLFVGKCIAQENSDKTATLTVTGEGITKQEALHGALRSAIEQAFGTFISSNTQVLNDELAKDEIVSIANGNIQKYEILSEVQLPDGKFANTVRATVSVSKLTSFCENKGITVEFKGNLFALNVKQQILNEQNELKTIQNMRLVLKSILSRSFDFRIAASQPTSSGNHWNIPITITATLNANINNVSSYLFNTLRGVACSNEEISNYKKLNKEVSYIVYKPIGFKDKDAGLFALRNRDSFQEMKNLIEDMREAIFNFSVANGINILTGNKFETFRATEDHARSGLAYSDFKQAKLVSMYFLPVLDMGRGTYFFGPAEFHNSMAMSPKNEQIYGSGYNPNSRFWNIIGSNFKFFRNFQFLYEDDSEYIVISLDNAKIGQSGATLTYVDDFTVDEIQKIAEYKINPIN